LAKEVIEMMHFFKALHTLFHNILYVIAVLFAIYIYFGAGQEIIQKLVNYRIFDKFSSVATPTIQTAPQKAVPPEGRPPYHDRDALISVRIEGTKEFNQSIIKALKTLKEKAPTHYDRVGKYVTTIEYTPQTNADNIIAYVQPTNKDGRMFFVSLHSKDYENYKYVSTLVHESQHMEQYFTSPEMFRDIGLIEHDAVRVEVEALKQVGAPQIFIDSTIDLLKSKWWENKPHFEPPPQ
jgi:hypothetical protein